MVNDIKNLTKRQKITKVVKLEPTEEYVYDISMKEQDPFFFANGHLVHNTDSAYYSAWPIAEELIAGGFEFNKDNVAALYDSVASETNLTFPQFMVSKFHCDPKRAVRIKANREICGTTGLFVSKKRYAIDVYDDEGKRPPGGKLKIMGMETQRADTPDYIQEFLKDLLKKVLTDVSEEEVIRYISEYRKELRKRNPWELGTPKRCNGLTKYSNIEKEKPGSRLPGHIRAAYNWNRIKRMVNDNQSMDIHDGGKTVFCKLKKNRFNITSCAYPIDETNLPDWFKNLPFDVDAMEETLIDKKVDNLIGLLGFDLNKTKQSEIIDDLFKFD